jgi:hypothetical protein
MVSFLGDDVPDSAVLIWIFTITSIVATLIAVIPCLSVRTHGFAKSQPMWGAENVLIVKRTKNRNFHLPVDEHVQGRRLAEATTENLFIVLTPPVMPL